MYLNIFFILTAVASHKYVISFCVGLELHNANTPKIIYATYIVVFALMSSIGIAIGIVITTISEDSPNYMVTTGVLQVAIFWFAFVSNALIEQF